MSEASSAPVPWCYEDDDVADDEQKIADSQIRRLPVVNRAKHLVDDSFG
jgi:hypothetical protein